MNSKNIFINNKIAEIYSALSNNNSNMNELIGEIDDLFSSSYKREIVADSDVVENLWGALFDVFIQSEDNDAKFDAISTMCDIYIYQSNIGVEINLNKIRQWRESSQVDESTPEIRDRIDDILSM